MIRLIARTTVALIADAVGLIAAAVILGDDMDLEPSGFLVALVLFAGTSLLIEPLLRQTAIKSAPALLGGSALLATLISLVVAGLSEGLSMPGGLTSWLLATFIVWAAALAAKLLLPLIIFRKVLREVRD